MNSKLLWLIVLLFQWACFSSLAQNPLRVFIRAGEKTHGPGQHDHPRFLEESRALLNERGAKAEGGLNFPTAQQLENTDVLVMYAAEAGTIDEGDRANLEKFLKRGGGMVVIHDAICGKDPQWFKTIIGGAWEHGHSKWFEGDVSIYVQDNSHPIMQGVSNFDLDDEIYYDLHLQPEVQVLASSYAPDKRNTKDGKAFPSVYDIVPQMWVYEKTLDGGKPYRAFVSIPGHNHSTFALPHYRALLLRGLAWAGQRPVDSLCSKEELASLRYPAGGPAAPDKASAFIKVPSEFDLNLVASEPLIEKPISHDWDAQGRLWIAETPEYPNGLRNPEDRDGPKENRPARDRISYLEDSNNDGLMDRKTVFFEGLELVTSLVFYKDGVIVSQAPDIFWLRDTDGDGKADKKITLFTGFGTRDTHAVISNMRWGHDGWIYATVGYSRGDIYSGDGKSHFGNISDGVLRFRPDGSAMEQFSSKGSNTWGVDTADDGEIFFSQANGNHIDHVVMPESALARGKLEGTPSFKVIEDHKNVFPIRDYHKQAYVQIDWVGGFTAASGACIYNGGAWPDRYNNTFYVTEPTVNLMHQDVIKPDGVSYLATRAPEHAMSEFMAGTDLWFRPIHARVGPDGAMYVLDFYNQAVVHNDTRGPKHGANNAAVRPDRDHYFGRIWRVQHKEAKKFERPELAKAPVAKQIEALKHPNGWVRQTAQRLLIEQTNSATSQEAVAALQKLALDQNVPEHSRALAFWTHQLTGGSTLRDLEFLAKGLADSSAVVRKNVARICATYPGNDSSAGAAELADALLKCASDSDARVQLEALGALTNPLLTSFVRSPDAVDAILSAYGKFNDPWRKSAVIALALKSEGAFFPAAFRMENVEAARELLSVMTQQRVATVNMSQGLSFVASQPASADEMKRAVLETVVKNLGTIPAPAWSPTLQSALQSLLSSANAGVSAAALPLIARWDKDGALKPAVTAQAKQLLEKLNNAQQDDQERARAASALLSVRQINPEIVGQLGAALRADNSPTFKKQLVEMLGNVPEAHSELVASYPNLPGELQEMVFNQVIKRPDSATSFVEAISSDKIKLAALSPLTISRLRTHSDPAVSERAIKVIDEIRGPQIKEKNALIAKFSGAATQPGQADKGHQIYTVNCAVCHKFNGEGSELAPDLTGMGAHGATELLVHILDPNRVVEPNFIGVTVELKDGETVEGIVARENRSEIVLRNTVGDITVNRKDIANQKSTGRSLMPEGFEALGADGLRDLLTYLCAGESRFRIIDLKPAFTANSTRGLYANPDSADESLKFKKFGILKVGDIPFEVVNPLTSASGKNLIVLKGGNGVAKTMPQKVVAPNLNVKANRLHFLGGVAGWGFPWGDEKMKGVPVAKVTVLHTDGKSEQFVLKNGEEFADYIGKFDVPGSKEVPNAVERGQLRWFSRAVANESPIKEITLESFDNQVAPTFVAITAEAGEGAAAHAEAITSPKFEWGKHPRILIVGGGSSHDFERWFNKADVATLSSVGSVNYTEDISRVPSALAEVDVLYVANNQPYTAEARQAVMAFADSGKPLLLVHPALWYNWKEWPEYNRNLVAGGSRSHEKLQEFEVSVDVADHPIMAGVPKTFRLKDELYRHENAPDGPDTQVLATGKSLETGKTWPVVWITKHPKTKIVCITLGHDGAAHDHEAFKTLLQNSVKWLSQAQKK